MALEGSRGEIKYAVINESTDASNEIVAAVTGKRIRILQLFLYAAAAVAATIEDEDSNALIGPCTLANAGPITLPFSPIGWQETPAGKALHLLLGSAVQVGGVLVYQEV